MLDPYVLLTSKGIQQRGALPAQERGCQKLPGVLDPPVSFKGTQQRGALPAQERGSQKLPGVLDPYVLLIFKGTQQRGALPAQERGSQKLLRVLDLCVLLTFKGIQQRGALPGQEREAPRSCCACWILPSSLLLKEFSREEPCQPRRERLPEVAAGAGSLRPPYF